IPGPDAENPGLRSWPGLPAVWCFLIALGACVSEHSRLFRPTPPFDCDESGLGPDTIERVQLAAAARRDRGPGLDHQRRMSRDLVSQHSAAHGADVNMAGQEQVRAALRQM